MQRKHAVLSTLITAIILAGCGKSQDTNNTPVTVPGPAPQAEATTKVVPLTPTTVAYYSEHLDLAKATMEECRKVAADDITPEIKTRCKAARSAWMFQVYKPGK